MRKLLAIALLAALGSFSSQAALSQSEDTQVIKVSTNGTSVTRRITLGLNKAAIVELDSDARDVLVSNPEIVDAVVRTPRRVFLLAQKTGQTNAFFFDGAGKQMLSIDIRVEKDVTDLATLIRNVMPNSSISVSALNDNVVLSGNVSSAQDSQRAQDLAARFAGDPAKVVNMLSVRSGEQVAIKVTVSEMQRDIAKQFGVNLTGALNAAGVPIVASTSNPYGLLGRALSDLSGAQIGYACAASLSIPMGSPTPCSGPNNMQGTVKALEKVGLVHILAEPNLSAVSGETAKSLVGGEFPVPVARDAQGNVTIQFKPFGVGLSFTPVVLSSGRISLQVSTEVSELTNTGAFLSAGSSVTDPTTGITTTSQGLSIPALSVRRAETTVEVPSGGTFAIAGLMQHTSKQELDAFPGLKDMPVLGALFRSRDYQNNETELVILVSAYLVDPAKESDFALPTDGFVTPADPETILLGRLNAVYKREGDEAVKASAQAPVGFIVK